MMTQPSISTYQQYLPAILQEDVFLGPFLLAFEKILSGLDETPSQEKFITAQSKNPPGLEEVLARIHVYFNPHETPEEFLPWLAGWVALSLRNDWDVEVKRAFILEVVQLYRLRGTKQGLKKVLTIYLRNAGLGDQVEIFDNFPDFPHYFQVQLTLNDRDYDTYWQQAKIAQAIIDEEKPAHTYYGLRILTLAMQITKQSLFSHTFKLPEAVLNQKTEKIELEAIVEVTQPNPATVETLKKMTVRIKDDVSDFHLLTPETTIEANQIRVKRTLYDYHIQTIDQLTVTIKNLNNYKIIGKVTIEASWDSHQRQLLNEDFELPAVPLKDILQICYDDEVGEHIPRKTIPTILGTTTQPLK